MKILLTAILGAAVLVLPASVLAKRDEHHKHPAIAKCKAERGKTKATRKAFKAKHQSLRGCVKEHRAAAKNAAHECKAERADEGFAAAHSDKTFEEFYGTNANRRNAFGKCVSSKVREQEEADEADECEDREHGDDHGNKGDDHSNHGDEQGDREDDQGNHGDAKAAGAEPGDDDGDEAEPEDDDGHEQCESDDADEPDDD